MLKIVKNFFTRKKRTDSVSTRHDQNMRETIPTSFVVEGIYNPITWLKTRSIFDRYPKTKKNAVVKKILNSNLFYDMAELVFFEMSGSKDDIIHAMEKGGIHDSYTDKNSIFIHADWKSDDQINGVASMAQLSRYVRQINEQGIDDDIQDKFFNSICRTMFNSTCISPVNIIEKNLNKYFTLIDNNGLVLMLGVSLDDAIFKSEPVISVDDPYKFIITLAYHDDAFEGVTNKINDAIDLGDGFKIGHVSYYNLMMMRKEFDTAGLDPRYVDNIFRFIGTLL